MNIKKVAIVGGGTMGRQIALNAAISGFDTTVNDSFPGVLTRSRPGATSIWTAVWKRAS
jgi:3-hydroxyacyl-CoA dehydrogenase